MVGVSKTSYLTRPNLSSSIGAVNDDESLEGLLGNLTAALSYAKKDDRSLMSEFKKGSSQDVGDMQVQLMQMELDEAKARINSLESMLKEKDALVASFLSKGRAKEESLFEEKLSQTNCKLNATVSELSNTKEEVAVLKAKLAERDYQAYSQIQTPLQQSRTPISPSSLQQRTLTFKTSTSPVVANVDSKKSLSLQEECNMLRDKSQLDDRRIKKLENEVERLETLLKKGGEGSMIMAPPTPHFSPAVSHIGTTFDDEDNDMNENSNVKQLDNERKSIVNPNVQNAIAMQARPKSHLLSEIQSLSKTTQLQREHNAQLLNKITNLTGNIQVCCRIRPLQAKEMGQNGNKALVEPWSESEVGCLDLKSGADLWKSYVFDKVWGPDQGQAQVYQDVEPFALGVVDGFNCCVMAYGQTGSGKTHTMEGGVDGREQGMSYRIMQKIFHLLEFRRKNFCNSKSKQPNLLSSPIQEKKNLNERTVFGKSVYSDIDCVENHNEDVEENTFSSFEYSIEVSMLEIYNEHVYDLLAPMASTASVLDKRKGSTLNHRSRARKSLEIRRGADDVMEVSNSRKEKVRCIGDVLSVLRRGNMNRATASTDMNGHSSRSHVILTVRVVSGIANTDQNVGNLFLVDLAGSERVSTHTNIKNNELKETMHINKSLSALGDVMKALDSKASFIPYRNSKLTYLLQDALSAGKSRAMMIVCVSPAINSFEDTVTTLQFATKARKISLGKTKPNEKSKNLEEKVKTLNAEKRALFKVKDKQDVELNSLRKDCIQIEEKLLKHQQSSSRNLKDKLTSLSALRKGYVEMTERYQLEHAAKEKKMVELDKCQQELRQVQRQLSNSNRVKVNVQRRLAYLETELTDTKEKVRTAQDAATEAKTLYYKTQVELNSLRISVHTDLEETSSDCKNHFGYVTPTNQNHKSINRSRRNIFRDDDSYNSISRSFKIVTPSQREKKSYRITKKISPDEDDSHVTLSDQKTKISKHNGNKTHPSRNVISP